MITLPATLHPSQGVAGSAETEVRVLQPTLCSLAKLFRTQGVESIKTDLIVMLREVKTVQLGTAFRFLRAGLPTVGDLATKFGSGQIEF